MADKDYCDSEATFCSLFEDENGACNQSDIECQYLSGVTVYKSLEVIDPHDIICESQAESKINKRPGILKRSKKPSEITISKTNVNDPTYTTQLSALPNTKSRRSNLSQKCTSNNINEKVKLSQKCLSKSQDIYSNFVRRSERIIQLENIKSDKIKSERKSLRLKKLSQQSYAEIPEDETELNDNFNCPPFQISNFLISQDSINNISRMKAGGLRNIHTKIKKLFLEMAKIHGSIVQCHKMSQNILNWTKYYFRMLKNIVNQINKIINPKFKKQIVNSKNTKSNNKKRSEPLKIDKNNRTKTTRTKKINKSKIGIEAPLNNNQMNTDCNIMNTQTFRPNEEELFECSQALEEGSKQTSKPWQKKDFWENKKAVIPEQWLDDLSSW